MKKHLSLIAFMMVIIFGAVACGKKAEPDKKYLRIAKDVELASMDQHEASDGLSLAMIAATIEGLYSVDAAGTPIPAIAESYEVSEDGLNYIFHMRKDAKWSNGTPVTANDFVFAWRRLIDPAIASEYNFIMDIASVKNASKIIAGELKTDELGVKALDENTLEVNLEVPVPYFLNLMSFPSFFPMNEKFVAEKGDQYAMTPADLLASGPFKMVEWNRGYGFKLDKNADYYDAANIKIDGLDIRIIKDNQTAALKFDKNELDLVKLSAELVDKYKSNDALIQVPAGYLWYMSPNFKNEIFSNVNARKALSHAVNKQYIVDNIMNDGSTAADFIVPVGLATGPDAKDFRATSDSYTKYDKEKALEYWNKAKSELKVDKMEIEIVFDDFESNKKIAEFIQSELQINLPGLEVKLKAQPKKNRLALMRSGDYDLGITRWGPDFADPLTYLGMFESGNPTNYPQYSNKAYDKMIFDVSKGELASKPEARWEMMKTAERLLVEEDAAVAPLYQRGYTYLQNTKVKGVENHSVGVDIYRNVTIQD
ncbi:peptide ABC transporter substrate-binding protein [Ilyobacter sp.]|uniref:peptide ABC transporter substrate-binding protein n=1 Tax=Ilyobacter sp. TaxID=3100343 RepID=UPI003569DDA5